MNTNGYYVKDFGVTIDVGKIFKICVKNIGYILLAGITSGLLFLLVCRTCITPAYTASTKVYILNHTMQTYVTTSDVSASTTFTKDYSELVYSRNILESVISKVNANMSFEELKSNISVQTDQTNSRILRIIVEDTDPYRCYDLADGVCRELKEYVQKYIPSCSVQIVENVVYPKAKSTPRTKLFVVFGVLLGGGIAFAIFCIIQLTNNKIVTDKDIRKYLNINVLGTIPVNTSKKQMNSRKTAMGVNIWEKRQIDR